MLTIWNPQQNQIEFRNVHFYGASTGLTKLTTRYQTEILYHFYFEVRCVSDIGMFLSLPEGLGIYDNAAILPNNEYHNGFLTDLFGINIKPNIGQLKTVFISSNKISSMYCFSDVHRYFKIPKEWIPDFSSYEFEDFNSRMRTIGYFPLSTIYIKIPAAAKRYKKVLITFSAKCNPRMRQHQMMFFPHILSKELFTYKKLDNFDVVGFQPTIHVGTSNIRIGRKIPNLIKHKQNLIYANIPSGVTNIKPSMNGDICTTFDCVSQDFRKINKSEVENVIVAGNSYEQNLTAASRFYRA